MPRFISVESEQVMSPGESGNSNLMLRIRRAMSSCGIVITDARWTFMRLFCAHCALRGQLWRPKVSRAMAIIIRDDQELRDGQDIAFPDTSSYGLRLEITRLRRRLVRVAVSDMSYHVPSARALGT